MGAWFGTRPVSRSSPNEMSLYECAGYNYTNRAREVADMYILRLLGTPQITQDDQPIWDLPAAKSQALLFYLACRGRVQSRLALSGLLWPDKMDTEARMNLRQALYQLRQTLPNIIEASRETIVLRTDAPLAVDVWRFEAEVQAGLQDGGDQLRAAADRYQGDFLTGFFLDNAPDFEEWVLVERERLRALALQAFHQLTEYYAAQGDVGSGLLYARRLLALEPLREESHQQLMRLLASDGQIGAALAQFERCRQLLADELGAPPSTGTVALWEAIKQGQVTLLRPRTLTYPPILPHNLPSQPTPFIGREHELAELDALCHREGARLITIIGPGGMGKTRFSLAFAERVTTGAVERYPDGVFFVGLANLIPSTELPITDQISLAIGQALGVTSERGVQGAGLPKQQLLDYLRPRCLLLLLDNFEHLQHGHLLLAELMQAAPQVRIIITSRERLSLYEERVFRLAGLALPELDGTDYSFITSGQFDDLPQAEAVQLFIQAAQRVRHTFQPRPDEWPLLIELCTLLNGMPLALELAAAWVESLSLTDILSELQQDLGLLSTDLNNVADRHRSLAQVFDYAWQHLTPEEQALLTGLTVFRGGFTRAAASAVTGHNLSPQLLANLVHKSLLTVDANRERYTIHELLRRFTARKTGHTTVEKLQVPQRHCRYFCTLLHRYEIALRGEGQEQALAELEADVENIRLAWQWAVAQREVEWIAAALNSLFYLYDTRSRFLEGEKLFREATLRLSWDSQNHEEVLTLAKLQARQGWFTFHLGQHKESLRLLHRSLAYLREQNHPSEVSFCLNYLGAVLRHQGKYEEANQYLQEALIQAQVAGNLFQASIAYNTLGQTAWFQGDYALARQYVQEALRLKRAIGDRRGMIYSLTYLGRVAEAQGDYGEARRLFQETLHISQASGDQRGVAIAWQNLGDVAMDLGEMVEAQEAMTKALALYRNIGDRLGRSRCLLRLGELLGVMGRFAAAESHLREGIELALAIAAEPVLVAGILGMVELWLKTKQPAKAQTGLDFAARLSQPHLVPTNRLARLQNELATYYPGVVAAAEPVGADLEMFVRDWVLSNLG